MELHKKFQNQELRETIFGFDPEYSDKYDLAIYLRRIVILSGAFIRVYFKNKKRNKENITSKAIERIVNRPYISIDNSVSILTMVQSAVEDIEKLGLSALKIVSDEDYDEYINLYELKGILQDETGKFFDAVRCKEILYKVVSCIKFITLIDIKNDGEKTLFVYDGENFDVSDFFKYEYCYLYKALQEVDPLKTCYIPL